jgi:murein DD-endopeptidase MepM/ murein hydrolase activator NlpD
VRSTGRMRLMPRLPRDPTSVPCTARRARHRNAVVFLLVSLVALVLLVLVDGAAAGARAASTDDADPPASTAGGTWAWPVAGARTVERAFEPPAHAYGAGHRGIDVMALAGSDVSAPAAGIVLFAGPVAGRSVVTIDHGGGVVSSYDPVVPAVASGDPVGPGTAIGRLEDGSAMHCPRGCLHVGVRIDGAYVDPFPFFVRRERSVLLPLADGARGVRGMESAERYPSGASRSAPRRPAQARGCACR